MREECDVREICLSLLWLEIQGFKDGGGLNAPREKREKNPKTTHSRINLKGMYVMLDSSFCCAPEISGAVWKCTLHNRFCFIIKCQIPRLADLIDLKALAAIEWLREAPLAHQPSLCSPLSSTEHADITLAAGHHLKKGLGKKWRRSAVTKSGWTW